LDRWVARQRQKFNGLYQPPLTTKQIELLKAIGMRFENIDLMDKWMDKYKLAKAYFEHYGNLGIPYDFKTKNGRDYDEDGVNLGGWIQTQRSAYKGAGWLKISPERIKLLEDIGINWFNEKVDYRLQTQEITSKNTDSKQTEVLNRFYSLLNSYDQNTMLDRDSLNSDFIDQLSRRR